MTWILLLILYLAVLVLAAVAVMIAYRRWETSRALKAGMREQPARDRPAVAADPGVD